jgi:hypothetical protein
MIAMEAQDRWKFFFTLRPENVAAEFHSIAYRNLDVSLHKDAILPVRSLPFGSEHRSFVLIKRHGLRLLSSLMISKCQIPVQLRDLLCYGSHCASPGRHGISSSVEIRAHVKNAVKEKGLTTCYLPFEI